MTPEHYPDLPGFKVPGTSKEAAKAIEPEVNYLRNACLQLVIERGPISADEAADILHRSVLSIRPRFSELKTMGKIRDSKQRTKNRSGRGATRWERL